MGEGAARSPPSTPRQRGTGQRGDAYRLGPAGAWQRLPGAGSGCGNNLIVTRGTGTPTVGRARLKVMASWSNRGWGEAAVGSSATKRDDLYGFSSAGFIRASGHANRVEQILWGGTGAELVRLRVLQNQKEFAPWRIHQYRGRAIRWPISTAR